MRSEQSRMPLMRWVEVVERFDLGRGEDEAICLAEGALARVVSDSGDDISTVAVGSA